MVAAVRRGQSLRSVAAKFQVSVPTLQRWVGRADGQRLDRVDFSNHSSAPNRVDNRTSPRKEKLVLSIRRHLQDNSDLGEFGAAAILRQLNRRAISNPPSLRTIGYILERHGKTDYRRRIRRPPPPKGWYLIDVAEGRAEIDSFDFVEGLVIRGKGEVEILNVVSLHGGLVESWPRRSWTTQLALEAIISHWRRWGLPDYAQFDNDTRFQGPHQHPDAVGRIIRMCLSLGVVPVFAPVREHGFQNAIENYNGQWQAKVWGRYEFSSLEELKEQSRRYVKAHRERSGARRESAPERREFPSRWKWDEEEKVKSGRILFIRRTNDKGMVEVLGHKIEVAVKWPNRLVRCEVEIKAEEIRFYGLRRREFDSQPLLRKVKYQLPKRYTG